VRLSGKDLRKVKEELAKKVRCFWCFYCFSCFAKLSNWIVHVVSCFQQNKPKNGELVGIVSLDDATVGGYYYTWHPDSDGSDLKAMVVEDSSVYLARKDMSTKLRQNYQDYCDGGQYTEESDHHHIDKILLVNILFFLLLQNTSTTITIIFPFAVIRPRNCTQQNSPSRTTAT
jgi:hypothetical protein